MAMSLEEFLEVWHNDSPFVQVQTSGSTGAPKPMAVEKRRMLASARITCDFLGLKPGDTALLCMPLDYIAGKMMVVRALSAASVLSAFPLLVILWPTKLRCLRSSTSLRWCRCRSITRFRFPLSGRV